MEVIYDGKYSKRLSYTIEQTQVNLAYPHLRLEGSIVKHRESYWRFREKHYKYGYSAKGAGSWEKLSRFEVMIYRLFRRIKWLVPSSLLI